MDTYFPAILVLPEANRVGHGCSNPLNEKKGHNRADNKRVVSHRWPPLQRYCVVLAQRLRVREPPRWGRLNWWPLFFVLAMPRPLLFSAMPVGSPRIQLALIRQVLNKWLPCTPFVSAVSW